MQRLHIVIADLYWPDPRDDAPYENLALPALSQLLSRGTATVSSPVALEVWVANLFGHDDTTVDFPWCAVERVGLGLQIDQHAWCRADPVHLKSRRNALYLSHGEHLAVSDAEAAQLVDSLNTHFAPDHLEFLVVAPERWHVRLDATARVRTTSAPQAQGRNIERLLPSGPDATVWTRRLNEAQMLLHEHPVNNARESRGAAPINSIWPWGFGAVPTISGSNFTQLVSASPLFKGLATLADICVHHMEPGLDVSVLPSSGNTLAIIESPRLALAGDRGDAWRESLIHIDAKWLRPALDAVKSARISELQITALSQDNTLHLKVTRSQLLRFWRKTQSWTHWRPQPAA